MMNRTKKKNKELAELRIKCDAQEKMIAELVATIVKNENKLPFSVPPTSGDHIGTTFVKKRASVLTEMQNQYLQRFYQMKFDAQVSVAEIRKAAMQNSKSMLDRK